MAASWRTSGRMPDSIRRIDYWGVALFLIGVLSLAAAVMIAGIVGNGWLIAAAVPGLFAAEWGFRHIAKWEAPRGV